MNNNTKEWIIAFGLMFLVILIQFLSLIITGKDLATNMLETLW